MHRDEPAGNPQKAGFIVGSGYRDWLRIAIKWGMGAHRRARLTSLEAYSPVRKFPDLQTCG